MNDISPSYGALKKRLQIHFDWYLKDLLQEKEGESWTIGEIQDAIHSATGVRVREKTIYRRNSQLFQEYQCSPLRRVDNERYVLDLVYYSIAADRVWPPPSRGKPRKTPGEI